MTPKGALDLDVENVSKEQKTFIIDSLHYIYNPLA